MIRLAPADTPVTLDRRIQGQFAEHLGRCIYEGIWVGRDSEIANKNGIRTDVVQALRHIQVPLVRWPGGCFADEYHWLKGVGPERQPMVNTHWGGVVEPNEFGTHEYFDLVNQLDAEAYICGNVGSGTVAEMHDWVEYMTLDSTAPMAELRKHHGREQPWKLEWFGVGNESWGCGGNMLPLHYANLYRQYQTYVRQYGPERVARIACGPNAEDYEWTEVLMARAGGHMDGLSLHYYTLPTTDWSAKGAATGFDEYGWHETLRQTRRMDELVTAHSRIMDRHDPHKRVALVIDEWGTWYDVEEGTNPGFLYQQNTQRDAMVAAINLNIFHRHADRVRMTNIAQMVNVLQSMILTDGASMITTPTYHVFDLYRDHQDAEYVPTPAGALGPDGELTVSRKGDDWTISAANTSLERELPAEFELPRGVGELLRAQLLGSDAPDSHNTFDQPDAVSLADLAVRVDGGRVSFTLPPHAVATVRVRLG
ncbi:alpha-N-arabinofuranosidase [Aestuariimicrobium kwangyangense]|uniref:alpha-N-arabinofuranosidase n=1 Tax=Aestuariimicrobium kwangyangense TaxID=396389 RepID=UPI0003B4337A|nr:alpha-L-arabinofuranosidase C-terminal domain-containing protein [Aestuariimicrobium kwangyangense]